MQRNRSPFAGDNSVGPFLCQIRKSIPDRYQRGGVTFPCRWGEGGGGSLPLVKLQPQPPAPAPSPLTALQGNGFPKSIPGKHVSVAPRNVEVMSVCKVSGCTARPLGGATKQDIFE